MWAEKRQADGALVAEQHGQPAGVRRDPWVGYAEGKHPLDALGLAQGSEEADPAAPVMADPGDLIDTQDVEQGEHVRGELFLVIAARWSGGPAVAA